MEEKWPWTEWQAFYLLKQTLKLPVSWRWGEPYLCIVQKAMSIQPFVALNPLRAWVLTLAFSGVSVNVDQYVVERRAFLLWSLRPLVSALNFFLGHGENRKSIIAWNIICLFRNTPRVRRIWKEDKWRAVFPPHVQFGHGWHTLRSPCLTSVLLLLQEISRETWYSLSPVASVEYKHCDRWLEQAVSG